MESFGQRVKRLREAKKLSVAAAASAIGVSRTAWYAIEAGGSGQFAGNNLVNAAALLGVTENELVTGKKPAKKQVNLANVSPVDLRAARPLISWIQAGSFNTIDDPYQPGDGEEFIETEHRSSKSAFWLRVAGDSMEPNFPAGTLVLCDPEMVAQIGNYCIAKDIDKQTATFKKLGGDEMQPMLVPLNQKHPTMLVTDRIRIIGRVIEYRNGGKL